MTIWDSFKIRLKSSMRVRGRSGTQDSSQVFYFREVKLYTLVPKTSKYEGRYLVRIGLPTKDETLIKPWRTSSWNGFVNASSSVAKIKNRNELFARRTTMVGNYINTTKTSILFKFDYLQAFFKLQVCK